MGASASVSKQDVSALSAEQKKALVAKLEPPYCEKKGVENERSHLSVMSFCS